MRTGTVVGLVVLASVFWGANFVLAGPVLADLSPQWAAAMRFVLGALAMLAVARWRGEALLAVGTRHPGVYLLLGLVGIGTFNLFFFYALKSTSAANAALIMATNPLVTTLIAALVLGERPTARQLGALPIALLGVVVVISGGSLARLKAMNISHGDLMMLCANLSWALYNVLSKRWLPRDVSAVANTAWVMVAGTLVLLAAALVDGGGLPVRLGSNALLALLVMSLAGTVLAYLFWNTGIARLGAGRTALFLNLVPVFAMLAAMVGGTMPTHVQLLGGGIVISGVTLAMIPLRRLRPSIA